MKQNQTNQNNRRAGEALLYITCTKWATCIARTVLMMNYAHYTIACIGKKPWQEVTTQVIVMPESVDVTEGEGNWK